MEKKKDKKTEKTLSFFDWSLSVKAVNDDSHRNGSENLFTVTLHDYDVIVKRPNTVYGVREHTTTMFIYFSKLWQRQKLLNRFLDLRKGSWELILT